MPAKLFKPRYTNRPLDTINLSANAKPSMSFSRRLGEVSLGFNTTFFDYSGSTATPTNSYNDALKSEERIDSILYTDLFVPRSSKILGGWIQLVTKSATGTENPFPGLDVALYSDLTGKSDQHNWRGIKPTRTSAGYAWRHVAVDARDNSGTVAYNAANYWFKIRSTAPPLQAGITSSAAAAVATTGLCPIGKHVTDEASSAVMPFVNAYGNVVLIESSSSTINNVLTRCSRSGTFTEDVNIVCKVYGYNATTRTIGALRATSNPVAASTILLSATAETSFTFSTFSVTAGEYVFISIEPQTGWKSVNTAFLNGRFFQSSSNSDTGANAAGSEEIMWWQPRDTGNRIPYFFIYTAPLLYTGLTGTTIEDRPYYNVIERLNFDVPPATGSVGTTHRLMLTERMMRTLEAYIYEHSDMGGIQIYLATGDNNNFSVVWDSSITMQNGLYLVYRNQRTFIT